MQCIMYRMYKVVIFTKRGAVIFWQVVVNTCIPHKIQISFPKLINVWYHFWRIYSNTVWHCEPCFDKKKKVHKMAVPKRCAKFILYGLWSVQNIDVHQLRSTLSKESVPNYHKVFMMRTQFWSNWRICNAFSVL